MLSGQTEGHALPPARIRERNAPAKWRRIAAATQKHKDAVQRLIQLASVADQSRLGQVDRPIYSLDPGPHGTSGTSA
ncbi:hypothetical protein NS277_10545 [Novosphingobium barchaimii]|nr:hypothetical protein NS277_10545 [Novosphingobium barchaimii]